MIRVVPTGDLGLDVLTGGGWRLVKRFEERESACVVVRGGPGAGKSTLGIHVALELANALGGDVAVGCVEILPTEYVAQLQSTRPSLEAARVVQLPAQPTPLAEGTGPRVFIGLMTELDPARPDLSANLAALGAAVESAGGKPTVFIVDSLIEGYGIGSSINRIDADATIKFAVQGGYALVLCEETGSDAPSPWVFAADTVIQLGVESRERGRWVEVKKHRFGPSATGRHELDVRGDSHPEVFPEIAAWRARWIQDVLTQHGFPTVERPNHTLPLRWASAPDIVGALVFVSSQRREIVQAFANGLTTDLGKRPFTVQFDALVNAQSRWSQLQALGVFAPLSDGAARTLRFLIEALPMVFRGTGLTADRIIIGDAALVLSTAGGADWVVAIETFSGIVLERGWGLPIVVYDGDAGVGGAARARLEATADAVAVIGPRIDSVTKRVDVRILNRWTRLDSYVELDQPTSVDRSPRPNGRG